MMNKLLHTFLNLVKTYIFYSYLILIFIKIFFYFYSFDTSSIKLHLDNILIFSKLLEKNIIYLLLLAEERVIKKYNYKNFIDIFSHSSRCYIDSCNFINNNLIARNAKCNH